MQQNSCPITSDNSSPNNNNYDSKFKSVKFAQELVNTKIIPNNDKFLQVPTSIKEMQLENTNNNGPIKIKATTKSILKSALRTSNSQQSETLYVAQ
jgi:hypothetical protein